MKHLGIYLWAGSLAALAQAGVAQAAEPAAASPDDGSAIIVTGTRVTGLRAVDSAAPISVIDSGALSHVGQPNLNQALTQIAPSFAAESFGGDAANLTLSARLRGLSPNHTLVLVNGKRRHNTANFHVSGGAFQGGAAPDIDLIPPSAIARIEILTDGAAAQYGSDAIAGVINIILKDADHGFTGTVTGGSYYKGGGNQLAQSANLGAKLGDNGFINITVQHRFHGYSGQGGIDGRVFNADGSILSGVPAAWGNLPGAPNLNPFFGDSRSVLTTAFVNAGYDFGSFKAYANGSFSRRVASSKQNYRLPSRILKADGTYLFPNGFTPLIGVWEEDYAATVGLKGSLGKGTWDISSTYGRDQNQIWTLDSANASLYQNTGYTPSNFYDGQFTSSQWTNNLDIAQPLELGLSEPANLAFGLEHRRETYGIAQGDGPSIYKEGPSAYPGFQPTDAGTHTRNAVSGYVDLSVKPVKEWVVNLAGRFEHYSDFGNSFSVRANSRYDFSPAFALRGTVNTGFRAPNLGEEYYSATQVSPTSAVVQLPANSSAAKLLGFQNLKPEKSTGISGGFVAHPTGRLTLTADAYVIWIRDRITGTGTITGKSGTTIINQAVLDAVAAHGNVLDPAATYAGVSVFTNGVDTRTEGFEFSASYPLRTEFGKIDLSLNGSVNKTKVTKNKLGDALINQGAISALETGSAPYKIGLGGLFTSGKFSLNLRETLYGPVSSRVSPNSGATWYTARVAPAFITDLEASYKLTPVVEVALGANNLFNKKAPGYPLIAGSTSATSGGQSINGLSTLDAPNTGAPYNFNGGYYYARLTVSL
jgi:iron complex outermembrane receptor protein